jgi:hypothetical protein
MYVYENNFVFHLSFAQPSDLLDIVYEHVELSVNVAHTHIYSNDSYFLIEQCSWLLKL